MPTNDGPKHGIERASEAWLSCLSNLSDTMLAMLAKSFKADSGILEVETPPNTGIVTA